MGDSVLRIRNDAGNIVLDAEAPVFIASDTVISSVTGPMSTASPTPSAAQAAAWNMMDQTAIGVIAGGIGFRLYKRGDIAPIIAVMSLDNARKYGAACSPFQLEVFASLPSDLTPFPEGVQIYLSGTTTPYYKKQSGAWVNIPNASFVLDTTYPFTKLQSYVSRLASDPTGTRTTAMTAKLISRTINSDGYTTPNPYGIQIYDADGNLMFTSAQKYPKLLGYFDQTINLASVSSANLFNKLATLVTIPDFSASKSYGVVMFSGNFSRTVVSGANYGLAPLWQINNSTGTLDAFVGLLDNNTSHTEYKNNSVRFNGMLFDFT